MTGIQLASLRRGMRLSPEEFATLCGVHGATVRRWEMCLAGAVPPMVASTGRVIQRLLCATATERAKFAVALAEGGWGAAWALLFAPPISRTGKPVVGFIGKRKG